MAEATKMQVAEGTPATEAEIYAAVDSLSKAQYGRLRRFAKQLSAFIQQRGEHYGEDDILYEAITRTLEGRRHWYKDRVDFFGHLWGVIKSIGSHALERLESEKNEAPLLESDLVQTNEEGDIYNSLAEISSTTLNPERITTAQQTLDHVLAYFQQDPEITGIIDCFRYGMTGPEIQEELGMSKQQYEAAVKRMRRNLQKSFPQGGA